MDVGEGSETEVALLLLLLLEEDVVEVEVEEEAVEDGTIEEEEREEEEEGEGEEETGGGAGRDLAINFLTLAFNSSRVRKLISTKELSAAAASFIGSANIYKHFIIKNQSFFYLIFFLKNVIINL